MEEPLDGFPAFLVSPSLLLYCEQTPFWRVFAYESRSKIAWEEKMRTEKDEETSSSPTSFIVKYNFFYLVAFCFFLCCNSLVRLSEECDVVGHKMKWKC